MRVMRLAVVFGLFMLAYSVEIVWKAGINVQLLVYSDGSYSIALRKSSRSEAYDLWAQSGETALFCDGQWHSSSLGTLLLVGSGHSSGVHHSLGPFESFDLEWTTASAGKARGSGTPFITTFQWFVEDDFFAFNQSFPRGANGTYLNEAAFNGTQPPPGREFNSWYIPMARFPSFTLSPPSALSQLGNLAWGGRFVYDDVHWNVGMTQFHGGEAGGPLVLFDFDPPAPTRPRALVLSSFDNFKLAMTSPVMNVSTANGTQQQFGCGISSRIPSLPSNFSVSFALFGSLGGINEAVHNWGKVMQKAYRTVRIHDVVTEKLGYWTDNGAIYFNGYWEQNADKVPERVLLELKQALDLQKIPIQYIQLDPWWYISSTASRCLSWTPQPQYFPAGLGYLRHQLGLPFVLYASYFDTQNYYVQMNFSFVKSVEISWMAQEIAQPYPEQAFDFYDMLFTQGASYGPVAFEIDFLDHAFLAFPNLTASLTKGEQWLNGLTSAALKHNLPTQFCMPLASDLLSALSMPAVTNARCSDDNFPATGGWNIGVSSMLVSALGLAPSKDHFWSNSTQPDSVYGKAYEHNPRLQAIIASLSTGPVGISDSIGATDPDIVMPTCMVDGTILKPSAPATPLDAYFMYGVWQAHTAHVWHTHSLIPSRDHLPALVYYELLAIDVVQSVPVYPHHMWPSLSFFVQYVVFRWGDPACINGSLASTCVQPFSETSPITVHTGRSEDGVNPYSLHVVCPVTSDGWALLGELRKYVTVSPNRFRHLQAIPHGGISVDLAGVPNETVPLLFMTPSQMLTEVVVTVGDDGTASVELS